MKILLTNDDGVHAPGLEVLEEIARHFSGGAPHNSVEYLLAGSYNMLMEFIQNLI